MNLERWCVIRKGPGKERAQGWEEKWHGDKNEMKTAKGAKGEWK